MIKRICKCGEELPKGSRTCEVCGTTGSYTSINSKPQYPRNSKVEFKKKLYTTGG